MLPSVYWLRCYCIAAAGCCFYCYTKTSKARYNTRTYISPPHSSCHCVYERTSMPRGVLTRLPAADALCLTRKYVPTYEFMQENSDVTRPLFSLVYHSFTHSSTQFFITHLLYIRLRHVTHPSLLPARFRERKQKQPVRRQSLIEPTFLFQQSSLILILIKFKLRNKNQTRVTFYLALNSKKSKYCTHITCVTPWYPVDVL